MRRPAIARSTKPIPRKRAKPRRSRIRDEAYLKFIRAMPCVVCLPALFKTMVLAPRWVLSAGGGYTESRNEAAHVGVRGLGQKSSDRETISLCPKHHRLGKESIHVLGKGFWKRHDMDCKGLVKLLNRAYEEVMAIRLTDAQ